MAGVAVNSVLADSELVEAIKDNQEIKDLVTELATLSLREAIVQMKVGAPGTKANIMRIFAPAIARSLAVVQNNDEIQGLRDEIKGLLKEMHPEVNEEEEEDDEDGE